MTETFLKVFPLYLASILSPGILALTVILLSKKKFGISQTVALFLGSLLTSLFIAFIGLYVGNQIKDPSGISPVDNIVDLILAALFLYFGLKELLHKDDDSKTKNLAKEESRQLLKWLAIGFIVSITNFDAVIFNITAAKEVGQALIGNAQKIIILIIGMLFFNLPIILPFTLYLTMPKLANKILSPLNIFLIKYGRYIVAAIFLIFAFYLGYKGLKTI